MAAPITPRPNLFYLSEKGFQEVLNGLSTGDLFSLGLDGIGCNATGRNLDLVFLEDARRFKKHIEDGKPKTLYPSILDFIIDSNEAIPMVKRCLEMYAEEYPEHLQYSDRSPLIERVVESENSAVLELLIAEGLAPSVADNGDVYMTKAIAQKSQKLVMWLVTHGQDLRSFRYSLDRRGMLVLGTQFYEDLRKMHPDVLDGFVPMAERQ
ncbi:hypothetical protein F4821DRAFT_256603 [Hypoxylon rubiginosum]|uniref:Uncharacterized protein n=1 Tax=Hypoxylon rubiginosum TaxID=110542 RepID=A0ACC0DBU1_9PEZI|nr:hypothetical protein F4821DRAFT_256603 [Hypoxylon rubiginosum]